MARHGGAPSGKAKNMNILTKLLRDESGASAAEYALILAIIGSAIALAAIALGSSIATAVNSAADCIDAPGTAAC
jgi:pilus assembly protein Flp/PilA